jgi:hypothetical protein
MKKSLLSLSFVLIAGLSFGQIYSATNQADYEAWTLIDGDGDGFNWAITEFTAPLGAALESFSWDDPSQTALTPDNFAISPPINCSGQSTVWLNWFDASYANATYSNEKFAVYVVTNTADILLGNVPAPVFETTLSGEGPEAFRSIDISSVAANEAMVFVVFRHYDCTDQLSLVIDDVSVTTEQGVNVEENAAAAALNMFPNPATNVLNVQFSSEIAAIAVVALDGKVIINETVNNTSKAINVAELPAGAYLCEVRFADGSIARERFVKH